MRRRTFLAASAAGIASASTAAWGLPLILRRDRPGVDLWDDAPFDFDSLTERMRERAARPWQPPERLLPEAVSDLNCEQHRAVQFRPRQVPWQGEAPFRLEAFHVGVLFPQPVGLYTVEDGLAHSLTYTTSDFEYHPPLDPADFDGVSAPVAAGFRLLYPLKFPHAFDQFVAFLGASYFRALGRGNSYGLSARGIAVNTAGPDGEEFPRFTDFFIERPQPGAETITVHAALEGPSLTGAYAIHMVPGRNTVMDVTARLFVRRPIDRLGIAPLTSMFLFAENNRGLFDDFRGEVHDSDGLKIVLADGTEIWRSLNNPQEVANSVFAEPALAGFGLFQRDRDFAHYQDGIAAYERRPSLYVEPVGDWGAGSVDLVEFPAAAETLDNIVAFWTPTGGVKAGAEREFAYRLTWGSIDEPSDRLARVRAVRTGVGGISGGGNPKGLRKFVVDFDGGPLRDLHRYADIDAEVGVLNGEINHFTLSKVDESDVWRLFIDARPTGSDPLELSAVVTRDGERASETWLYQWQPRG